MKLLICSPAFYVFLLIVAAWLCRHRKRWKWTFAALALFFALFFSLEPIYEIAAKKWSEGYPWFVPKGKTYQYGIVLGGFSYWDWERNRPEFGGNADRLTEGIQLYHKGIIRKLVIASDGSIIQREDPAKQSGNPQAMTDYLVRLGIPRQDIILETKATTTHENAVYIKQLLKDPPQPSLLREGSQTCQMSTAELDSLPKQGGQGWVSPLLITTSTHMRRALMAFQQEGITADPYVTDCIVKVKGKEGYWLPSLHVIRDWQSLIHEFIGFAYYKTHPNPPCLGREKPLPQPLPRREGSRQVFCGRTAEKHPIVSPS